MAESGGMRPEERGKRLGFAPVSAKNRLRWRKVAKVENGLPAQPPFGTHFRNKSVSAAVYAPRRSAAALAVIFLWTERASRQSFFAMGNAVSYYGKKTTGERSPIVFIRKKELIL